MDHDHGRGGGMRSMNPPPPSSMSTGAGGTMNMTHSNHHMMMHMTFFWGNKNVDMLFPGWPGASTGMYYFSLFVVFILAVSVEGISRTRIIKKPTRSDAVSGMMLTFMHMIRMGLAYLIMLAVMSFNGGVFIVAVAGHGFGFLVFGSRVIWKRNDGGEDDGNGGDYLNRSAC